MNNAEVNDECPAGGRAAMSVCDVPAPHRRAGSPASAFMRIPQLCLVSLVRAYQRSIGRILPNSCRFTPTCSEYFIEAVRKHGVLGGTWFGLKRIVRCNPFCKSGHDPVP